MNAGTIRYRCRNYKYQGRIYSENGDIFGEKIFTTPFYTDRHSGFYEPGEIFDKLLAAISHFNQPLKKEIVALSVSSFAETMVGLNAKGRAITRSIAWFDTCTEVQFKELQDHLNTEEIYSTTGLIPHYIYSFYKLLWHRTNSREVFDQVTHWTSISGYILFALMIGTLKAKVIPVHMAGAVDTRGIQFWFVAVRTLIAMSPPVILALLAQRYIVRGLTFGAVKG